MIFLDFDGVIVCRRERIYSPYQPAVAALISLLKALKGYEIVVSSSWREGRTVKDLRKILKDFGINFPVSGKTAINNLPREEQIKEFLKINRVEDYVVIDDEKEAFEGLDEQKIIYVNNSTEEEDGITPEQVESFLKTINN